MHVFCFCRVFTAVVFTGITVGRAISLTGDTSKAKTSTAKILALIGRVPEIDSTSNDGLKPVSISLSDHKIVQLEWMSALVLVIGLQHW